MGGIASLYTNLFFQFIFIFTFSVQRNIFPAAYVTPSSPLCSAQGGIAVSAPDMTGERSASSRKTGAS